MIDLLIYDTYCINNKVMCMILCSQIPTMCLLRFQLKTVLSDSRKKELYKHDKCKIKMESSIYDQLLYSGSP